MITQLWMAAAIVGQAGEAEAEAADRSDAPRDIVVTGERVARPLRETPSSVVVLREDEIVASTADRLDQLLAAIPNIQPGAGEEGPAIRGQDSTGVLRNLFAFLGGSRPRVTVQVDGRPVSFYEYVSGSAPVWDMDRVEVFRSPQTTTQGRNSIAGAIFMESNDPVFAWEGAARAIAGDFRTRQASAMVSGPLIGDQLAIRFSGDLRRSRMASDMADKIAGADIDRDDFALARVKLLLTPSALPGHRLEATFAHTQSQAPQFEGVAAPFRERRLPVPQQTNGIMRVNVESLTLRLNSQLGEGLSSSVVLSGGDAELRRFGLPGLGFTRALSDDRTAEAIVRWSRSPDLTVVAGASILGTRQRQTIDITGLNIGIGGFRDRQRSLGLFGEVSWRPLPPLTLTAGLRHQRDRQRRSGEVGSPPTGLRIDYHERFEAWLPKVSAAVDFADDWTAGVMVQRAYNPGGTSVSLARRAQDDFDEERLTNVEGFVRGSFAGGRGRLSANVFRNAIVNSQRQLTVPVLLANGTTIFANEFANAPRARAYGLEAEVGFEVSPRLSLRGGLGLLRTKLTETVVPTDVTLGKQFQRSPRFSGVAALDWRPVDAMRLSAQVRRHARYFSDDANTPARAIGPSTIVDLRASWTAGRMTMFGYARNAFNSFALTYLFTPTFGTAADPRELGFGVEGRF